MKMLPKMLGCLFFLCATAASAGSTDREKDRAEIRKASSATLKDLYKVRPAARSHVESAAGYATFNNFGMKIFVAGGGSGKGMAVKKMAKCIKKSS